MKYQFLKRFKNRHNAMVIKETIKLVLETHKKFKFLRMKIVHYISEHN